LSVTLKASKFLSLSNPFLIFHSRLRTQMTLSRRIRKQRMKCFLNCRWATCIRLYRPNYRSHGNRWLWRHTCVTFKPRVLYKVDYYYYYY